MRISDWSSDVCSSDLDLNLAHQRADELREEVTAARSALVERQARLDQLRREAEARRRRLADIETERQSWARRADEAKTHLAELEERLAATAAENETLAGIPVALAEKRAAPSELIDAEIGREPV